MPTDPAYRAADPDDFPSMIQPTRYAHRSSDFEEIIARTEEHFWNPEDPDYVDFATPFAADETIVPSWFMLESNTAVWDRLDEGQRIRLVNESARKWPPERRRVVLLHELAHIRRVDWITLMIAEIAGV